MNRNLRTGALTVLAALAAISHSIVAYSNFGPDQSYEISGGWTVSGPTSGFPTQVVVFQFTAQATGSLASVVMPFGHVLGTNVGRVILYQDSGSDSIGDPLIQWTQSLDTLGQPDLVTLTNSEDVPFLVTGKKYWLGTHYVADDTWDAWNMTTVADAQLCGFSYNGGDSYNYSMQFPAGAFEVNVVPEPAGMAVLGFGIGIACFRKKRA